MNELKLSATLYLLLIYYLYPLKDTTGYCKFLQAHIQERSLKVSQNNVMRSLNYDLQTQMSSCLNISVYEVQSAIAKGHKAAVRMC